MTTDSRRSLFVGPFSRLGLTVAAVTFVIDQADKWWMLRVFDIRAKEAVVVNPFFNLVFALNKGVSYSFLTASGANWQRILFLFAATVSVLLAVWLATGVSNRLGAISVGLIMGGALGNGLDRLTLGGVADFFQLHAFGFYWYVFNLADVAIVAGVIGLLYESVSPFGRSKGATTDTKAPQNQH